MEELSLHVLDIVQNSISAGAELIEVEIIENEEEDTLTITVTDNGCGMSEEVVSKVTDPFTTGRKTRRVGLGIPLFKLAAEMTGGSFLVESELEKGTKISAVFGLSHIDRQPLGDMASTMHQLIVMNEQTDFLYLHKVGNKEFLLDTREIKKVLDGVSLKEHEVMLWLLDFIKENEESLK
ncbi:MAG: ATP-binding protein [Clostridia bacterium]|nr:ATP-binding protein [Clostridia bacterium]